MTSSPKLVKLRRRFFSRLRPQRLILGIVLGFVGLVIFAGIYFLWRYQLTPRFWLELATGKSSLLTQTGKRTNILLLGMRGEGDGATLTDTMMIGSLGLGNKKTVLVSLPRDIWVPTLKEKINSAYEIGERSATGSGLLLSKAAVEEVVGLPIHYAILIDFAGFNKMIDTLGGIDVLVSESFIDDTYPITGRENDLCGGDPEYKCRYETISFAKGKEHMSGERALKYVRSRHAQGAAGTDFARGRRQQAVILALRNKVLSFPILAHPKILGNLIDTLKQTVKSDLSASQAILALRVFWTADQPRTIGLGQDIPESEIPGLLINPPLSDYDGRWVLIPKHGDFSIIHTYVNCVVEDLVDCDKYLKSTDTPN